MAGATLVRQEPAWLIGRNLIELVHPADRPRVRRELRNVAAGRPRGRYSTFRVRAQATLDWRVIEVSADNLLDDPDVGAILVAARDVTEQLAREQELAEAAFHDALTSLPNRAKINRELDSLVATDGELAVAFLGIDRFTLFNDSLGHTSGDRVLQIVAKRLRSVAPTSALVGRFEGDVLVLLLPGAVAGEARALLWRAIERIREPMFVAGHELHLSASAGIVQREAAASAEGLLRDAGSALHRAKVRGGGRVERFEAEMRDEATARLELEANLRRALSSDEMALAFQPIVRLADRVPVGSEALVRWHRAEEILLPPQFIPVAEESGLIVPLGAWIVAEAARLAPHAPGQRVSVNLSPRQLAAPGLVETISRALTAAGLPPSALDFEITETLLIEDFDFTVRVLGAIHRLGCRVGLDDFGTGYSSLGYLRRLPIDFLKLDRSLTADVDVDPQARAIVGAVTSMAEALHVEVIAEGVEREAQTAELLGAGVKFAQGYLFGVPAEVTLGAGTGVGARRRTLPCGPGATRSA